MAKKRNMRPDLASEEVGHGRGELEAMEQEEILPGIFQRGRTHYPIYEKIMIRATWVVTWIPIVFILILLAMTFADVILRKVFKTGVSGMYDYTGFIMVIVFSFALMLTTMNDEHIEITLFFNIFPKRMKSVIVVANYAFVIWICMLQINGNYNQAWIARRLGLRPMDLWFEQWPFYLVISAGFFLMLLILTVKLLNYLRKVK